MHAVVLVILLAVSCSAGSCFPDYTEEECNVVYDLRARNLTIIQPRAGVVQIFTTSPIIFPSEIALFSSVSAIWAFTCPIIGTIPTELCNIPSLREVYLREVSIHGTIPQCLLTKSTMRSITVDSTVIGGTVPSLALSNLTYLKLSNSAFEGTIPALSSTLRYLSLDSNSFTATVPSDIDRLTFLDLSHNKLTGTIPVLPDPNNLRTINLANNDLNGSVPYMPDLDTLDLSFNLFDSELLIATEYFGWAGVLDLTGSRIDRIWSFPPRVVIDFSDVDECALQRYICPRDSSCTDGWFPKMSYTCECRSGYRMLENKSACVDIDECALDVNACVTPGTCLNTQGSYECCSAGTYSNGTNCVPCYSNVYVYEQAPENPLPLAGLTPVCFGTCKSGVSVKIRESLYALCPSTERIYEACSYPCIGAGVNMTIFDTINMLHTELSRGGYIEDLVGSSNATLLSLGPSSITLDIYCDNCTDVVQAARLIAPQVLLVQVPGGLRARASGTSKVAIYGGLAAAVGGCFLLLILLAVAMLARDRTSRLHESLAKTIRVPLTTRLTRQLLTESSLRPTDIEGIVSVKRIYNTVLLDNFVGNYLVQKERLSNSIFHKKTWSFDQEKTKVYESYQKLASSFDWNEETKPVVLCTMHGTSAPIGEMIAKTGFAALSTLDTGWYGTGIYFTTAFDYCLPYIASRQRPAVIISYVLPGNVYPVTSRADHEGKPIVSGYQSHYVQTSIDGKPCNGGIYNEIVLSQESQILPMYLIEIAPRPAKFVPLEIR